MAVEIEVSWDEAVTSGGFVTFKDGEPKELFLKDWKLVKIDKFKKEQVELQATVIQEDGKPVDKKFTTMSNRLKTKLRPILEAATAMVGVKVSIVKVGDKFDTAYSVKRVDMAKTE